MTTIFELRLILQNILDRVVINILINISPSNIFLNIFLPAIFHQNCQAVSAVVSINGLRGFKELQYIIKNNLILGPNGHFPFYQVCCSMTFFSFSLMIVYISG